MFWKEGRRLAWRFALVVVGTLHDGKSPSSIIILVAVLAIINMIIIMIILSFLPSATPKDPYHWCHHPHSHHPQQKHGRGDVYHLILNSIKFQPQMLAANALSSAIQRSQIDLKSLRKAKLCNLALLYIQGILPSPPPSLARGLQGRQLQLPKSFISTAPYSCYSCYSCTGSIVWDQMPTFHVSCLGKCQYDCIGPTVPFPFPVMGAKTKKLIDFCELPVASLVGTASNVSKNIRQGLLYSWNLLPEEFIAGILILPREWWPPALLRAKQLLSVLHFHQDLHATLLLAASHKEKDWLRLWGTKCT